jgi:intergrase/recombinase
MKDRVRYAQKFGYCLFNRDFSELNGFAESKRRHVLEGLSALAKFLGIYQEFGDLLKAYGLKWASSNAEDLIIFRMIKAKENNGVLEWIREIKANVSCLSDFIDFMLVSGLRFEEAINSYNLIIDLAKEDRLSEYYNNEKQALEHYRFKQLFIRRTKKAFLTFIPIGFLEKISQKQKLPRFQIDNWIKRNGFKSRFSDIREYYAPFMTKWLTQPEIDFLQGKTSSNVFMRNYFNPALISDLKDRAFQGIREVQTKV